MAELNYHHLRYFWAIAHQRSLTRAAEQLHVSQSALSIQLRQLEERLGHALFERRNRRLVLTEAGRIALAHADTIFRSGEELVSTLKGRPTDRRQVLRVGAVATLSRNFQMQWLRPLIGRDDVELVLHAGGLRELLMQLGAHALDVVLTNHAVPRDQGTAWHSQLIAEQAVSLVSAPPGLSGAPGMSPAHGGAPARPPRRARTGSASALAAPAPTFRFPDDLREQPVLLPSTTSAIRTAFDLLMDLAGIRPVVLAEVDDMAMLRLMARETGALTLVPPVVVRDELQAGVLVERCRVPQIQEAFYAITARRRFPPALLKELLATDLGADQARPAAARR
jgi:LysR family transcriptional regulator, transcriptional activator of nhaA